MKYSKTEIDSQMWDDIYELLTDIFDRMEMNTTSNFDQIVEFIYLDIHNKESQYNVNDRVNNDALVNWSFRKWIDSQTNLKT